MATVTKDFRIKSGLVVEGANATVDGSDIITEDAITGGTQTNITVTYDPQAKTVSFVAENGVADSTTDDLEEGDDNLYFTDARARAAVSAEANGPVTYAPSTGEFDLAVGSGLTVTDGELVAKITSQTFAGQYPVSTDFDGNLVINLPFQQFGNVIAIDQSTGEISLTLGSSSGLDVDPSNFGLQLADAATNTGTFGSTTKIPSITVDAKGRVTAVTTNDVATNLSVAGDSGTDTVDLLNDTLTINGTNGISAAVTDNTITVTSNATASPDVDTIVLRGSDEGFSTIRSDIFQATGGVSIFQKRIGTGSPGLTISDDTTNIYANGTFTGSLNVDSGTITNLSDPTNPQDAATKIYVDSVAQGLDIKESVRVATTVDVPVAVVAEGFVMDGVTLVSGDRILLKNQTTPSENGIYVVGEFAITRSSDANEPSELNAGTFVFVEEGTAYGDTGWVVSSDNPLVIGTDAMEWTQFSGAGTYLAGNGLTLTGNTFSIDDAVVVTETDLNTAVGNLTTYIDGFLDPSTGTTVEYIDDQDAATLIAANAFTEALVETGDATATPTYLALDINDVAKQVAASATTSGGGTAATVYEFDSTEFRSAKFLVKLASSTHTQVSEVMLTLDSSDNVAVTEYAIVGTNGNLGDVSATVDNGMVQLTVQDAIGLSVQVSGTLLV